MPEYVRLGEFDEQQAGHSEHYYAERYTFIDCRGVMNISPSSIWGYNCRIITASHDIRTGGYFDSAIINRPITVEDKAWVTSFCILYNCYIGHNAIVSIGSVVAGQIVPPWTIVAGNPLIKRQGYFPL